MSDGTMMTGSENLFPWLRNDTAGELHKKLAFLTFRECIGSGDGSILETDHLRNIVQANQIKSSCWLGHLSVEDIVDLLKGTIQEGWYEKKLEVLKDLDWFIPATPKDTGKPGESVNAARRNGDEVPLLLDPLGPNEEKNSKNEPALILERTARESKAIIGRDSTTLAATKDAEYKGGQVDTREATKDPRKDDQASTSSQKLVTQNQGPAQPSRKQETHDSGDSCLIEPQRERGRATRLDPSLKRRRSTPSPKRAHQRRRINNLGGSYQAHNRFGINTGGNYVKASTMISPTSQYQYIGRYRTPQQHMKHFYNFEIQQQILDDTHHCIVRALYNWAQKYDYGRLFRALLWCKAGHAELHEFYKVLRSVHINEADLDLFGMSVNKFKDMLCRVAQIRHCAVHHRVDAPVSIIQEMVHDCWELTFMLRDSKANELMETIWIDTLEEISFNSNDRTDVEELHDRLRRLNKKMKKNDEAHRIMSSERRDIQGQLGDSLTR
ncbi:hypothetical protein BOTCAL_0029g00100 [Botryotinia calthae]|uniref:Uncharacterized protein n=1 Tax=Botryotinia calthae TaxID=38488 RepID=A0A4Y8DG81_9HELO|nr:hypothetical protein BOTCAL_0029g00100 [Botryotinia calthae]